MTAEAYSWENPMPRIPSLLNKNSVRERTGHIFVKCPDVTPTPERKGEKAEPCATCTAIYEAVKAESALWQQEQERIARTWVTRDESQPGTVYIEHPRPDLSAPGPAVPAETIPSAPALPVYVEAPRHMGGALGATPKQVDLLVKLAREKKPAWFAAQGEDAVRTKAESLTKATASERISALMAEQSPRATVAAPTGLTLEHGRVYVMEDGRYLKVAESKSGNLYGKVWTGDEWEYTTGILRRCGALRYPTADEAARWGHEHHACMFCGTNLRNDGPNKSVEVGYGPVCAEKYNLPWG